MMEIFDKINEQGKTIILITHDPDVAGHAGRMVELRDGYLTESKTRAENE